MSVLDCNPNLGEMHEKLAEARAKRHTRLFALAYDPNAPLQWYHRQDEKDMERFLNLRDNSESILFNCAVAVVVVNPTDSDETIQSIIADKRLRKKDGLGYFSEAF